MTCAGRAFYCEVMDLDEQNNHGDAIGAVATGRGDESTLTDLIIGDKRASKSWFTASSTSDYQPDVKVPTPRTPYFALRDGDSRGGSAKATDATCISVSPSERNSCTLETSSHVARGPDELAHMSLTTLGSHNRKSRDSSEFASHKHSIDHGNALQDWCTRWCRDWWALEIASILLGTICIVVIAVMLLNVNGNEMPQWQLGITVDLVMSLLAGFSKSCLLMPTAEALGQIKWGFGDTSKKAIDIERIDKASRGTWGSLVLLIRDRGV